VLHGHQRGKAIGANVISNFEHFGLRRPDLILGDTSLPMFRGDGPGAPQSGWQFDAIICDPPYGVRAGARRSGRPPEIVERNRARAAERVSCLLRLGAPLSLTCLRAQDARGEERKRYYEVEEDAFFAPGSQPYAVEDVISDLLVMAARRLRLGGRLVYLIPSAPDWTDEDLPRHPCLALVASATQLLAKTSGLSRKCVAMEKRAEFDPGLPAHRRATWRWAEGTFSFASLLDAMAAPKSAEDAERRAYRRDKRKARRKEARAAAAGAAAPTVQSS
jgi:tRNA (guanine10-N2)-methyltransferase